MSGARYAIERLRRLYAWPRYARIVAEAAREALGDRGLRYRGRG